MNFDNKNSADSFLHQKANYSEKKFPGYLDLEFETMPQNLKDFLNFLK